MKVEVRFAVAAMLVALPALGLGEPALAASSCSSNVAVVNAVAPDVSDAFAKAHPRAYANFIVTVGVDGHPSDIRIVDASNEAFAKAAVIAARDTTYKPAMRNCKPVAGGKYQFHAELSP